MAEIVVSEFMDETFVEEFRGDFGIRYCPHLADRPEALGVAVHVRGLIVRAALARR